MVKKIVKAIIGIFGGASSAMGAKYILVFVISLLPILELRGGLIAAALLGVKPLPAYIISIIGNLLPIPFILWLLDSIFAWMKKHNVLKKFVLFCERKGNEKKGQIEKYGFWGLVIFVGIPLPGTGAWTGALIATILRMNKKKAFIAILLGVIMASIIMMLISYGLLAKIV
jgi:uncharacterized membrane protein